MQMLDSKSAQIPRWALEPLSQFLDSIQSTHDFYHLTIDGLQMIIRHHELIIIGNARIEELKSRVLELGVAPEEVADSEIKENQRARVRKQAKERADLAQREVANGFPVLHAQQVVSLWSAIECFVEDILVAWLSNAPEAMKSERLRKIKIPLADFDRMTESERKYFLVSELQREPGLSQRNEIEKFESLLELAGFSGKIYACVKRDLVELGHVRNVLLHRRGIVDAKFRQACPWMSVGIGQQVGVNSDSVERYSAAVLSYFQLIVERMKTSFKLDTDATALT